MKKMGLFVFGMMVLFSLVSAGVPVGSPHGFWGSVTDSNGADVDDGVIIGKIGGIEAGRSDVVDGGYDMVVESGSDNVVVDFYFGGDLVGSFDFVAFEISEFDLEVDANVSELEDDDSDDDDDDGGSRRNSGGSYRDDSGSIVLNSGDDSEDVGVGDLELGDGSSVGMTGAVVGFVGTTGGMVVSVFVILILGMLIGVLVRK